MKVSEIISVFESTEETNNRLTKLIAIMEKELKLFPVATRVLGYEEARKKLLSLTGNTDPLIIFLASGAKSSQKLLNQVYRIKQRLIDRANSGL